MPTSATPRWENFARSLSTVFNLNPDLMVYGSLHVTPLERDTVDTNNGHTITTFPSGPEKCLVKWQTFHEASQTFLEHSVTVHIWERTVGKRG